jgi:hypothetical protein
LTVTICCVEVVSRIGDADPPPLPLDGVPLFEGGDRPLLDDGLPP